MQFMERSFSAILVKQRIHRKDADINPPFIILETHAADHVDMFPKCTTEAAPQDGHLRSAGV